MTGRFSELAVYQRSADLADEIRTEVFRWMPADLWTAGIQALRAADSVGANIAEATGRRSAKDQVRFLLIARASAIELQHWMLRARARDLHVPRNALERAAEAARMINGMIRDLERR